MEFIVTYTAHRVWQEDFSLKNPVDRHVSIVSDSDVPDSGACFIDDQRQLPQP